MADVVGDASTAALRWLATADARAAAVYEVTARSLPKEMADDLLSLVAVALAQRFASPSAAEIDDPVAYARRSLTMRAIDLQRGAIRDRHNRTPWPVDAEGEPVDVHDSVALPIELGHEIDTAILAVRRAVAAQLSNARPWAGAAAMTVLTLTVHRDVPVPPGVPTPDANDDLQLIRWAALYLAGQRTCFPTDGNAEDDAMRKRRSRALRAVDDVLVTATAASDVETRGV